MFYNYSSLNRYNNYNYINESKDYSSGNTKWIISLGTIDVYNPKLGKIEKISTKTIVNLVDEAMSKIEVKFPFLMPYIRHSKRMYVPYEGGAHATMAVDADKNLWINIPFVCVALNRDVNRIFGILFHELMHNFLNHISRSLEIVPMEARKEMAPETIKYTHDVMNICMDYEVNGNMVADRIVAPDFWEKLGGMNPMSKDTLDTGEPIDKVVKDKMWEEIYRKHGKSLYKHYKEACGVKVDEKFLEAMEAIKKCAKILSDESATEREKEAAKDELEETISKLYGKKKKKRSILSCLKHIQKTRLIEIGNIAVPLRDLIYDYYIQIDKMNDEDVNKCIADANKFKEELLKNVEDICDEFYSLVPDTLKEQIEKTISTLIDGTNKIYAGKETMSDDEKEDIIDNICDALEDLISDDIAKEKAKKERKKREKEKKKKRKERAEKKKKKMKERSILFNLYNRLLNLSRYNTPEVAKISDETSEVIESICNILEPLLAVNVNDIKKDDVIGIIDLIPQFKELIIVDLYKLIDDKYIVSLTKEKMKSNIEESFSIISKCFNDLYNTEYDETIKGGSIASAVEELGVIGRYLRTPKKYRPSDEFKKAYMEEMERLTKIRTELGKKGIVKELKDLGY